MNGYTGVWKYVSDEQIRDMLLSFRLLGDSGWAEEKIMACLFALSNHPEDHYHQVRIPKKSGGYRTLDVPDGLLGKVQRNILRHVLEGFAPSQAATAYRKGGSVLDNAARHSGKRLVLKMDIHDFFRNVTFPMVLHAAFPVTYFPTPVGTMLTSLCCLWERLPQGASTSPAISNLVMGPFDRHMLDWCGERGIAYSRYSDDMTFSGDFDAAAVVRKTEGFLRAYGLEPNREKTRVCSNGSRQMVTGLVVNDKPRLPRDYRRRLRQEIHYCRTYGVEEHLARQAAGESGQRGGAEGDGLGRDREGKRELQAEGYVKSLLGKVSYLLSVNPQDEWFGEARRFLLEELRRLTEERRRGGEGEGEEDSSTGPAGLPD